MKKVNQKGFTALEAILILVVVGLLGGTGYYVYHTQKTKTTNSTNASQQKTTDSSSKTSKVIDTQYIVVRDNQKYLSIKEWGVMIPVNSDLSSVVYAGGHYDVGGGSSPDGARLGLLSLGSSCAELPDTASAPMGWYVRFTQADVNAENSSQVKTGSTSLHELSKSAVMIPNSEGGYGAYYIAYAKPDSDCSNGESTATVNAASAALEKALKSIKESE